MEEERSRSTKTLTFLFLGICIFTVIYAIMSKFIGGMSAEELSQTGNRDRFKFQVQQIHKYIIEDFQSQYLITMAPNLTYSTCNATHRTIPVKTLGEEKVNYLVKVNAQTFITEFYVSNNYFKIECKDPNGIRNEVLDRETCKIENITIENKINYNDICN